jgi:hypothetical protein
MAPPAWKARATPGDTARSHARRTRIPSVVRPPVRERSGSAGTTRLKVRARVRPTSRKQLPTRRFWRCAILERHPQIRGRLHRHPNAGRHGRPRVGSLRPESLAPDDHRGELRHIGESRPTTVQVKTEGATVSSSKAVSIGLIVTEGVINALKHAFPEPKEDSHIVVTLRRDGIGLEPDDC